MAEIPVYTFVDGWTYEPDQDDARLGPQLAATFIALTTSRTPDGHAGGWCTLHAIRAAVEYQLGRPVSEAAVSARLRDLRKLRNGLHIIDRKRREPGSGTYLYRLIPAGSISWSIRWREYEQQLARTAVADEQRAADELSGWLNRWRHVVTDADSTRIASMAGAILRGRDRHQPMAGQTTLLESAS